MGLTAEGFFGIAGVTVGFFSIFFSILRSASSASRALRSSFAARLSILVSPLPSALLWSLASPLLWSLASALSLALASDLPWALASGLASRLPVVDGGNQCLLVNVLPPRSHRIIRRRPIRHRPGPPCRLTATGGHMPVRLYGLSAVGLGLGRLVSQPSLCIRASWPLLPSSLHRCAPMPSGLHGCGPNAFSPTPLWA